MKSYFPECWVVIRNVEEHVRLAEAAMFPARKDQEESWVQEVMEEVEPGKVSSYEGMRNEGARNLGNGTETQKFVYNCRAHRYRTAITTVVCNNW